MGNHAFSELRLLNPLLLGVLLAANLGYYLSLSTAQFPWLAYIGAAVGLAIILILWIGKRSTLFIFGFFAATILNTLHYEWHHLF